MVRKKKAFNESKKIDELKNKSIINFMKKIFLISSLFLFSTPLFAQTKSDTSEHLTFKNVPIDGTLSEFIMKMKKAGFIPTGMQDGMGILEGEFASYPFCKIGVQTLQQKDLVSKIVVIFPNRESWQLLSANYLNLKEMLTEKYGKPYVTIEKFETYEPSGDDSKLFAAKRGDCKFYSIFSNEKGTIHLTIDKDDKRKCFVSLTYVDKINSANIRKQALGDL